jgi:hypothetical protein
VQMTMNTPSQSVCKSLEIISVIIFSAASGGALVGVEHNPELPASSIHQMVKNVAWNEMQASEHPANYYRYIERTLSADGSSTTDEIATPHGDVNRLIEVNNGPPNQQQLEANQQLLARLPGDEELQESRHKDQQSDALRRDNVIRDIPNAFIYTYTGRDQKGLIMLKFRPAPNFQPSSRQSLVLQGMAGELWVDPSTQRMVKIDGSLIKDVKIGWGFLARLNKGGTFLMEQSQGPDGTWHQKLLSVHFDGTVLIFKHIHIRVRQIRCCFERVPDNLSIREAVYWLQTKTTLPKGWQARLDAIERSAAFK